jgi:outer membrane protein TolC
MAPLRPINPTLLAFSLTVLILLGAIPSLTAQQRDTLSLQAAVQQAVENNYSIQVARTNEQISDNSLNIGNAGLLPSVSLSSSGGLQQQDTRQEFEQPLGEQTINGAQSSNLDASVNLQYTLFDGLGNTYNYRQLKTEKNLTEAQARQTIEQTLLRVVQQYYQVARLRAEAEIAKEAVTLSQQRLSRVETGVQFGNKSRVDLTNAQVDLDTDSTTLIEAKTQYRNARRTLNVLLGQAPNTPVTVEEQVSFQQDLERQALLEQAQERNSSLQAADYEVKNARLQKKIANASYFPEVNLTSSYTYSQSASDAGFLNEQRSSGIRSGLELNMPLFSGFQNDIRAENAELRLQNQKNRKAETKLNVRRDLTNAYATYEQNLRALRLEKRSVDNARLNLRRTRESYQVGQATATQLREAQVNFTRAKTRLTNARYDAKLAEVELYQLAGLLLDEL